MKKQYDVTKLTDELSKSVFFQEPEETPKQQVTRAEKHQSAKAQQIHSTEAPSNQSTKEPSRQSAKDTKQKSTLALKHFSSYLPEALLRQIKVLAAQRDVHDYDVLQEAVEQYLEREQVQETNTH